MVHAEILQGKSKECVLCGTLVQGGADGMEAHAARTCAWRPGKPALSLGMDGR